ncbi:RNA polymerase sigma factor [Microlunatus parietis]|uniref:RNA polymerase sigma-70 factor (ECF subfamily) n=1 Tax=Microlunatus parietis TaxID=682979 RepID=A0A7Y9I6U6_9ACTN|nr:DUF6596 domain-containing protein [Microlunatus parietis]NYE71125.1 RNA polymerase sigma-70 factor (ECF subfamily) [Microlunatus parietis]
METWPADGVPEQPVRWLVATARRKLIDTIRRDQNLRRKLPLLAVADEQKVRRPAGLLDYDDRLRLIFTCCHPALAMPARVALTLRMVGGLTTAEIANAFLVPEATMAARLTRAKKKITAASIAYRVPADGELPERLTGVLTVLYLIFNEGYAPTGGTAALRPELIDSAIDLGRVLVALLPDEAEVAGLLALMLLTDARRDARLDEHGRIVLLPDQDRRRWDRTKITEGLALLDRIAALPAAQDPGRYVLQAAIAGAHASAPSAEQTDWAAVVAGYDRLHRRWPSPIVALNRAVALSHTAGPAAALELIEELAAEPELSRYHYLPAARADLLRRLGRADEARAAYTEALRLGPSDPERAFLESRLAAL